jgi:hypothetical protein
MLKKFDFEWIDSTASSSRSHTVDLVPDHEKEKIQMFLRLPIQDEITYFWNFMWGGAKGYPGIPHSGHRDGSCAAFFALQVRGQKQWHIEFRGESI